MNYELASQLRDAGFPQVGSGKRIAPPDKIVARRDDFAYVPTLEELIEACGNAFDILRLGGVTEELEWQATARRGGGHYAIGTTPTEAVARLWLALNKSA